MKRFAATCLSFVFLLSFAESACAQANSSKQQIEGVIETFRKAIIDKDQNGFMQLFLKEDITWTGVTGDASVERIYANRSDPKSPRLKKSFNSSPREFIGAIAKRAARTEETFSNVRIESDDDVAQVWFDYTLTIDNYKQNWGKESWQLVRTDTGWKIAAVVWSQEFNPVRRPKASASPTQS